MFENIWNLSPTDILDYPFLMEMFKEYQQPKLKIAYLLKKGSLVRVKKGLYVLGDPYNRGLYWTEVLANLIYGPSYISLEYALSYYGLIPERVIEVTSMTCNRNKQFHTPFGRFSYRYINPHKYPVGVTFKHIHHHPKQGGFLIATPEKALADCVARYSNLKTHQDITDYVFGLRIEESDLAKMRRKKMDEIAKIYQNHQVNLLKDMLKGFHVK